MRTYVLIVLTLIGTAWVADEAQAQRVRSGRVVYSSPAYSAPVVVSSSGYYDSWGTYYSSTPTVRYSTSYYSMPATYSTTGGYYYDGYYYTYPSTSRYYESSPGYYGPNMYINTRGAGGRGWRVR